MERSAATRNPEAYIKDSSVPLVIDEIQLVREIFRPLKKIIDDKRYAALENNDKVYGCYLLTGSANLLAIPELADAMVGRMGTLTLLPFSASEVYETKSTFLDRCFSKDFSGISVDKKTLTDAMQKASFPELLSLPIEARDKRFTDYVKKITLEDPRHLYNLEKSVYMHILL